MELDRTGAQVLVFRHAGTAASTWFAAGRMAISAGSTAGHERGRRPLTGVRSVPMVRRLCQQPPQVLPISGPGSMPLNDLVAPNAVLPALKVNSKKQAIQELAAEAAKLTGENERGVFETVLQRDKLGSTGIGHGIAIPHGKLA